MRELKRLLRARWTRPMADEQRELCRLKHRATELCALRAFARGRFHLQKAPRDAAERLEVLSIYHQRIVDRLGPSYTVTLSESA